MDDRQQIALARHEAALEVLRESDSSRVPFVLCLRKFDISVLHGPLESQREPIDKMLLDALPPGVKLISVQQPDESEIIRRMRVWYPRFSSVPRGSGNGTYGRS